MLERLHDGAGYDVVRQKEGLLVEPSAVPMFEHNPVEVRRAGVGPEEDGQEEDGRKGVPDEGFVGGKSEEALREGVKGGIRGSDPDMVLCDAEYDDEEAAEEEDACSEARWADREPRPEH